MADRYNNLNNTAPEVDPLKQKKPKIDKSDFDLSQALYFKALDGMIIPFWHLRVIPNSSIDLSIAIRGIMTNPYVKELLSGKRAYVHVYHSDLSDIWEGADELIKKGRDFNTKLTFPMLGASLVQDKQSPKTFSTLNAGSPSCYLGLPVLYYDKGSQQSPKSPIENIKPVDNSSSTKVQITNYSNFAGSCLPLVMYQQIYQAHYLNKNLINGNTDWLPQVENHFILPLEASGQYIYQVNYDINKAKSNKINATEDFDFNSEIFVPRDVDSDHLQTNSNKPFIDVMRFRQFKGDMFTSGSPFPDLLRGDVPVMSFSDLTGTIDWSDVIHETTDVASPKFLGLTNPSNPNSKSYLMSGYVGQTVGDNLQVNANPSYSTSLKNALDRAVVTVQNQLSFNLNALRALDVYTLLGERAARTDGTYNNYIKTMFNVDPRKHMHEPRYLGGFYLDFVNSTIEQTSETSTTALGTVASRGIAKGNGHIGKFTFNDHGYLMAILDIVDETVYTGGVDRDWTDLTFEDQYVPLFNGLAPQATRVQELFLTGTKATNEEPFNYVERYSHLKSRRNKALGQMSLPAYDSNNNPIDLDSPSYLHTRRFTSKPEFNNLWVTMTPKNIDMTPYTSTQDYPFLMTAVTNVSAVLPLPYITVPSGLAIMA